MEVKATDLDAIFNGAGSLINTTQNVTNAIAQGIGEVKGIMDNSRRSMGPMQPQQYQYQQPITYGYGYGDNSYNGYPGYPGFSGMSGFGSGYPQTQMNMGYPGFTNQAYGNMGGYTPNNSNPFSTPGPQGGAWY